MRLSQLLLPTLKEVPSDAETASHRLMLRAGMIRPLASGLYSWLPLGLRVLRRVEQVVREEMNAAGAQELLMPTVQPAELWQESGRWEQYGPELLRLRDRHQREFCYGPTHEEVITDLVRGTVRSYRQLPAKLYQIQTKFRDEIRPRFGVMRSREFVMKDAYSFHLDQASLDQTYAQMHQAYSNIFSRLGLEFRPVRADSGAIGGSLSHEFHVLADSGEDAIAFSDGSDYAANIEAAEALAPDGPRPPPAAAMDTVATPGKESIDEVSEFLSCPTTQCLKTLMVDGEEGGVVALVLRGDHELNLLKAAKLAGVASPLNFAGADAVQQACGARPGSIGPVGLTVPIIADHSALVVADFVCGANRDGHHLTGVNWGRDLPEPQVADLRNVEDGDPSPDGQGQLTIRRGIEVGHIFQLGRKYSEAMDCTVLDESGKNQVMTMGCYGIGITRVVAAAIEQNHDDHGIVWPAAIAPFDVVLLGLNHHKSVRLTDALTPLYQALQDAGLSVLWDDRPLRPGVMFADADLIGIPHRLVLGERGLDKGLIEYKGRRDAGNEEVALDGIVDFLLAKAGRA